MFVPVAVMCTGRILISRPAQRLAWLTLVVMAIQFLTSKMASSIQARQHLLSLGGDALSIGIGPQVHAVQGVQVLALQALILAPAFAALAGVSWLRWFPLSVLPGVFSNGAEALVRGSVRNWLELSIGTADPLALSAGDVWVLGALIYSGVQAARTRIAAR
jgi:hypothetical protein